jgi:hypothetical protein
MIQRGNTNQIIFEESQDSPIREAPTSVPIIIRISGDSLVHEPTSVVNRNRTMLMLKRNLYHLKNLKKQCL